MVERHARVNWKQLGKISVPHYARLNSALLAKVVSKGDLVSQGIKQQDMSTFLAQQPFFGFLWYAKLARTECYAKKEFRW